MSIKEGKGKASLGRPTLYSDELLEKTREYVYAGPDELPSVEGLALYIGINRKTIYAWEKEEGKEEFCNIIDDLRSKQAKMLIENGLRGEYNATITKLMLSKHGYSEKQEHQITGADDGPVKHDIAITATELTEALQGIIKKL